MTTLLLLWACSFEKPLPPPPEPEPPTEAQRLAVRVHMQGHLKAVDAVRTALVHGDLAGAKQSNRDFLDHKVSFDLPGDWLSHVSAMGLAAVALDQATDLPSAAQHAAEVAHACGGCHSEVGADVQLPPGPPADPEPHGPKETRELTAMWHELVMREADGPRPEEAASALIACATCHAKAP